MWLVAWLYPQSYNQSKHSRKSRFGCCSWRKHSLNPIFFYTCRIGQLYRRFTLFYKRKFLTNWISDVPVMFSQVVDWGVCHLFLLLMFFLLCCCLCLSLYLYEIGVQYWWHWQMLRLHLYPPMSLDKIRFAPVYLHARHYQFFYCQHLHNLHWTLSFL